MSPAIDPHLGRASIRLVLLVTVAITVFVCVARAQAVDWIRAGVNTEQPVWGLRGGLQFAIPPGGFTSGSGGPRGLIRIGYPTLPEGRCDLVNFIAIEPVVNDRRGFSELERSTIDQQQGRLLWVGESEPASTAAPALVPGSIAVLEGGVEELTVPLAVERFDNGAHVRLVLSQRSDAPDELRLRIYAQSDSAPIDRCILTATMGNKARMRLLWVKNGPVSSLDLYSEYRGPDFTAHTFFPLSRLPRTVGGDVLIAATTDESDPAAASAGLPFFWQYRGGKVTQYWRKPAAEVHDDLRCAVNGRYMYWMSHKPLPGGVAYENFELVEAFRDGQQFIFGITRRPPSELRE
ncbi:hypothetical protein ACXR0O_23270 [Verrucomicrobiota bacterium sgz303538]